MILGADVGGTKTLLGLFRQQGTVLRAMRQGVYASLEYGSFEEMAQSFLAIGRERPVACAVGVAGPVVAGRSQIVNLPWTVDERSVGRTLAIHRVKVLNDLEATAWGVASLRGRQIANLTTRLLPTPGNVAVIAAGTGLGMAIAFWDGARHLPSASEGGHQDFAPRTEIEIDLLQFLRGELDHVSVERLVCGDGFSAIYRFLVATGHARETAAMRRRLASAPDRNAEISLAGLRGEDRACARALELFVTLYGAAAGNLALCARATAGVYVAGGIAPKIAPAIRAGSFLEAFRDKGRLRPLVERIPVRLVLEKEAGLLGAAVCAARMAAPPRR